MSFNGKGLFDGCTLFAPWIILNIGIPRCTILARTRAHMETRKLPGQLCRVLEWSTTFIRPLQSFRNVLWSKSEL